MKALVTGGGGFLGGAIVRQLVKRGDEVKSFSRGEYPFLNELGVNHIKGDVADTNALCSAAEGCDVVFHVAAKAGDWGPYDVFYRTNVEGTMNVIDACKTASVSRLVFTSSPSVVFNGGDMENVDESVSYAEHFDAAYPATKAIAEQAVLKANGRDLATVALRPRLIWGPGDNNLFPRLAERARTGMLCIVGTGENLLDICYIGNAAKAHVQAADKLYKGSPLAGNAYFVSDGTPQPLEKVVNMMLKAYGLSPIRRHVPFRIAYCAAWLLETIYRTLALKGEPVVTRFVVKEMVSSVWFNLSAAGKDFGYVPEISFEEGYKILSESLASNRRSISG